MISMSINKDDNISLFTAIGSLRSLLLSAAEGTTGELRMWYNNYTEAIIINMSHIDGDFTESYSHFKQATPS